jgi:hypothetical protein
MITPKKPFDFYYKQASQGETQYPSKWSAPFDTEFRDIVEPNVSIGAMPAILSIGWEVYHKPNTYVPAYQIVKVVNLKNVLYGNDKNAKKEWKELSSTGTYVTDRISGIATVLKAAFNEFEAIISWFHRDISNSTKVLCRDVENGKIEWYTEEMNPYLIVALDENGNEVSVDESTNISHYMIDNHPKGITYNDS